MKQVVILIAFLSLFIKAKSQVYWDGEGSEGQWSDPLNWSTDVLPGSGAQVVLDNSMVDTSYVVVLPQGNVSITVGLLLIKPSSGKSIQLILPVTNTSPTGFLADGIGDAVILDSGAVFRNSSGSTSGSPVSVTTTNFFRINNGGRYIHNCERAHATTLVARLSNAPGTELGVFEFDVPTASFTFSFSGRVYGTLQFSSRTNASTVTYVTTGGSIATANGDIIIGSGVNLTSSITNNILVKRNLIQDTGSVLNISNNASNTSFMIGGDVMAEGIITETGTGQPSIMFNGINVQQIHIAYPITGTPQVIVNNPSGVKLLANLSLPAALRFITGPIRLGEYSLNTQQILDYTNANFVITNGNGMLQMQNVSTAVYPVGHADSSYSPVDITNGGNLIYSVRVKDSIDPNVALPTYGLKKTWVINSSANPVAPVQVGFQYESTDASPQIIPGETMELLQFLGGAWNITGAGLIPSGSDPYKLTALVDFFNTPFAIGKNGGWLLPVRLLDFRTLQQNNFALIKWRIENNSNDPVIFKIEHSSNGGGFRTVGTIHSFSTQSEFEYSIQLNEGVNLFRIRIIERNGLEFYSKTQKLLYKPERLKIISIEPAWIQDQIVLNIFSDLRQRISCRVVSVNGMVLTDRIFEIAEGNQQLILNTSSVPSGYYILTITGNNDLKDHRWIRKY